MKQHEENDYEMAYEVVRAAMKVVSDHEIQGRLQSLKNALYLASCFVNEELDVMEIKANELGLDKWQEEEVEEEMEELEFNDEGNE